MTKPRIFVIMPFREDFFKLYEELQTYFSEQYTFSHAGDLDNHQSILKDIVEGISNADVVIADVTGLNANVFYELGLSHALNKKTVIISQNVEELPFDIKAYRVIDYSTSFYKIKSFFDELSKILAGAMDNSVSFGNPVSDYRPQLVNCNTSSVELLQQDIDCEDGPVEEDEKGLFDYVADIQENAENMTVEINAIGQELVTLNEAVNESDKELKRVKANSGEINANFMRNVLRKLSTNVETFSGKFTKHVSCIASGWSEVEEGYLALLDNKHIKKLSSKEEIVKAMSPLVEMRQSIGGGQEKVEEFINAIRRVIGFERKLNKSSNDLIQELVNYRAVLDMICSSVDRILTRAELLYEVQLDKK